MTAPAGRDLVGSCERVPTGCSTWGPVDKAPVTSAASPRPRPAPRTGSSRLLSRVLVLLVVLTLPACSGAASPPATAARNAPHTGAAAPTTDPASTGAPTADPATAAAAGPLLRAAAGGDGDSWRDTTGREYRLGLVNTPEVAECYGSQATARRKELVAAGFRALVYAKDRYGRAVSLVTTADGTDLNVSLARDGYANDRYLEQYRHENPGLAKELDGAFAAAKRERAGLWAACPGAGR